MLTKIRQLVIICAISSNLLAVEAANPIPNSRPWILIADWQTRRSEVVTHSPTAGTYGRSRYGAEAIYQTATGAIDLEYYKYAHNFSGALASGDCAFGKTTDLMVTGFRQWDWNGRYGVQLLYALESAAENSMGLSKGFRWGLGGAVRWRPDTETDVAIGVQLQDRFEAGIMPIPYLKLIWSPTPSAEFEARITGLQNGIILRGFLTEDKSTTVDLTVAYETLTFRLTDGSYGSRAVSVGEVVTRVGLTQFLETSGTWFVRASLEWVPFSRYSFKHASETVGVFQNSPSLGAAVRLGARF
jgi:hypothetical protein